MAKAAWILLSDPKNLRYDKHIYILLCYWLNQLNLVKPTKNYVALILKKFSQIRLIMF